jgi:hypothetical protein
VVGFVDGEGHFAVNVILRYYNSKCSRKIKENYKSYPTFQIRFSVSQHVTSVESLYLWYTVGIKSLISFFECGYICPNKGKVQIQTSPIFDFRVNDKKDLKKKDCSLFSNKLTSNAT